MYINKIKIQGFRNFKDSVIEFTEGINVIIGHNNAGKSNALKALSLILDTSINKRLEVDDFFKTTSLAELQGNPPKVIITLSISQSKNEDLMSDDLVTVAPWLIKLAEPYEALLTYIFFLPVEEVDHYKEKLGTVTTLKDGWLVIKHEFLKKYISKIYGGNPSLQTSADHETLGKFDYQFLNAIRDVERDMFTGRTTLLREVIDFFMDYEIKNEQGKDLATKVAEITTHKLRFSTDAQALIGLLQSRMEKGTEHIMKYATETGASFNSATPKFDGQVSEAEMYSALRLIITYSTGIEIPATHNGLGYNNLIYMSLLLAKMQVDTNGDYLGSNAKVFPVLVIEEPEAHLHPSLQYKFLKFLRSSEYQKARQVFITSHSPNITAAVDLDQIICISIDPSGAPNIGYPGKVFSDDALGKKSKAYVQRFLDATRSDMLFARNIIFVEGLAEHILLPTFARYCSKSLEDTHTTIINLSGRYFEHFLQLFDNNKPFTIHKKVSCITDRDPSRKKKAPNEKQRSCYPFETGLDTTSYDYFCHAESSLIKYGAHANIRFFTQDAVYGKTLEYQIMFDNPGSLLLLTDSIQNETELKQLFAHYSNPSTLPEVIASGEVRTSEENTRIIAGLTACSGASWDEPNKIRSLIASRYLNSIDKGGNALELSNALENNLSNTAPLVFNVSQYLKEAIDWACQ